MRISANLTRLHRHRLGLNRLNVRFVTGFGVVGNDLRIIGGLFDIACDAEYEVEFVFPSIKVVTCSSWFGSSRTHSSPLKRLPRRPVHPREICSDRKVS